MIRLATFAFCLLGLTGLAGCNTLPSAAPQPTQHDLGGPFNAGTARSPVPLRAISVTGVPLINNTAIQYREAAAPTRRGVYAYNRWAAVPATMVDTAMARLLASEGNGRCRLQVLLADFIIDVDARGGGQAVIAADLKLWPDGAGTPVQHALDIAVPMPQVSPAAGALAMREAVRQLGEQTSAWLGSPAGRACRS